jgi:hypothetical protein
VKAPESEPPGKPGSGTVLGDFEICRSKNANDFIEWNVGKFSFERAYSGFVRGEEMQTRLRDDLPAISIRDALAVEPMPDRRTALDAHIQIRPGGAQ